MRKGTIYFIGSKEDCEKIGQPSIGDVEDVVPSNPKVKTHFVLQFDNDGSLAIYPLPVGYTLMVGKKIRMRVTVPEEKGNSNGRRNDLREGRSEGSSER